MPEISRGTVYAALAELTELGLLAAHGNPEPVRYETNTDRHQHFRCRLCLRVFDVQLPHPRTDQLSAEGFVIEALVVAAEGICAECVDYDQGLRSGAKRARNRPSGRLPDGLSAATVATPVGTLTIGATPRGVVRLVFDSHADVPELHETIRRRRGGQAARAHVVCAKAGDAQDGTDARGLRGRAPRAGPRGLPRTRWRARSGARCRRGASAVGERRRRAPPVIGVPAGGGGAGPRGRPGASGRSQAVLAPSRRRAIGPCSETM